MNLEPSITLTCVSLFTYKHKYFMRPLPPQLHTLILQEKSCDGRFCPQAIVGSCTHSPNNTLHKAYFLQTRTDFYTEMRTVQHTPRHKHKQRLLLSAEWLHGPILENETFYKHLLGACHCSIPNKH